MAEVVCAIEGCDKPSKARGWCKTHWARWRRTGDPNTVRPNARLGVTGPSSDKWRGDSVAYSTVHTRLRTLRGKARAGACENCGAAAAEWAFNHDAPKGRVRRNSGGAPYSSDVADYIRLCVPCHVEFDARGRYVRFRDGTPRVGTDPRTFRPIG